MWSISGADKSMQMAASSGSHQTVVRCAHVVRSSDCGAAAGARCRLMQTEPEWWRWRRRGRQLVPAVDQCRLSQTGGDGEGEGGSWCPSQINSDREPERPQL